MSKTVHITHNDSVYPFLVSELVDLWTPPQVHSRALTSDEFAAAVSDALLHPVGYPPVSSGVVPGDVVAIVIDAELKYPDAVVRGVLRALDGLSLSRIDVVVAESSSTEIRQTIQDALPDSVELVVHSGKSRDDLRYLAANEAANPIYLNRKIVDADLVIPVFSARQSDPLIVGSAFCPVFPSLADIRSQARSRIDANDITTSINGRRTAADDEATRVGWLLGLQWLVSVEVTSDGNPAAVFVGTRETLTTRWQASHEDAVQPNLAEVVVACVEGGTQQKSLTNLLRAALVARSHAATDASIVLVSDVEELGTVDEFAGHLYEDSFDEDVDSNFAEEDHDGEAKPNTEPDEVILSSVDHARLMLSTLINDMDSSQRYLLLSNCNEEEVESFGFGFVQNAESLSRLIDAHQSCTVIRHAQLVSMPVQMPSR